MVTGLRAPHLAALAGCLLLASASSGCTPARAGARPPATRGGPPEGPETRRAWSLDLNRVDGLAVGAGAAFLAGTAGFDPPRLIDGVTVSGAGGSDLFVGRLHPAGGTPSWLRAYGDEADQFGRDAAGPTADGTLAVIGRAEAGSRLGACRRVGEATACDGVVAGPNPAGYQTDFLLLLDAATGAVRPGTRFVDGGVAGALLAVAAHPALDLVAVCGTVSATSSLCRGTTPASCGAATTFGGGATDLLVALFDSSGDLRWARQVGSSSGLGDESCNAVAIAADGTVYAVGKYQDELDLGTGPLPSLPNSTAVRHLWVARFDAAGATLAATAFGTTAPAPAGNVTPYDLALDPAGHLVIGGSFTASFPIGALVSAGGTDAFVAKLTPALAPRWGVRLGGPGTDLVGGLALAADGQVVAVGSYAAGVSGAPTSGAAALPAPAGTAPQAFLLALDGGSGTSRLARGWGDAGVQGASRVALEGRSAHFAGTFLGTLDLGGPAGPLVNDGPTLRSFVARVELE